MRNAPVKVLVLIAALTTLALSRANDRPGLPTYRGTGMFLMLSDIHFDPFTDPAIMKQLGAMPLAACQASASGAFSKFGSETNYPLLKSTLEQAAYSATLDHFRCESQTVAG